MLSSLFSFLIAIIIKAIPVTKGVIELSALYYALSSIVESIMMFTLAQVCILWQEAECDCIIPDYIFLSKANNTLTDP